MYDLNDLATFAAVVEHGSFTAAAAALGIAKSQISHRVARLEERLGVRLIQRTTRRLHVTEIGQRYYQHCRAMLAEAGRAQHVVEAAHAVPNGSVHVACPTLFSELILGQIVTEFMRALPQVRVKLDAVNRTVDVIAEGYDVAFRVRTQIEDSSLVVRSFGLDGQVLVAGRTYLDTYGRPRAPNRLAGFDSLGMAMDTVHGRHLWQLSGARGKGECVVEHRPRLVTDDMLTLKRAALLGLGLVVLPEFLCADAIASGELERVLPGWECAPGNVHAVYPSRHGQPPAVRSFIDFVAPRIEAVLKDMRGDGKARTRRARRAPGPATRKR